VRAHAEQLLVACSLNDVDTALQLLEAIEEQEDLQLRQLAANISDVHGQTPLLHASKHNASSLVPRLLQLGADPAAFVRPSLNSCLHLAALPSPSQGQASVTKMLIQRGGCPVDAPNANGDTPLMFACGAGNVGTAAVLLKAGASPAACNKHGLSSLMVAASAGSELAVGLCLRALAAAEQQGHAGAQQQGNAATEAGRGAVSELCEGHLTRAALHHTDDQGNSALHYAARNGHESCVQALLAAGADPTLRNHAGRTPLVEAKLTRSSACIKLLESSSLVCPPNQAPWDLEYQQQEQQQHQQSRQQQQPKVRKGTPPSASCPKASDNEAQGASGSSSQLQSVGPPQHCAASSQACPGLESSAHNVAATWAEEEEERCLVPHAAEVEASNGPLDSGRDDIARQEAGGGQEDGDPTAGWVQVSSGKKGRPGSFGQGAVKTVAGNDRMKEGGKGHTAVPACVGSFAEARKVPDRMRGDQKVRQVEALAESASAAARRSLSPAAAWPAKDGGQMQERQQQKREGPKDHHKQKQSCGLLSREQQQQQRDNECAAQQHQHTTQQQRADQENGLSQERGHPQAAPPTLTSAQDRHSQDGSMDDTDLSWMPQFQAFMQDACPQASNLEVLPHHLACVGIEGLSFSQLEALEVLHHSALARIAEAKLELARVQERLKSSEKSRLEEELRYRRLQLESMQAHAANLHP